MDPRSDANVRAAADVVRGGATRLARRLRSERPANALSSSKISLLSHLRRHGPSSWPDVLVFEPHQSVEQLEQAAGELDVDGLVACRGAGTSRSLEITAAGRTALAADGVLRSHWLVDVLRELPESQVALLAEAGALMTELANRPGRHEHRYDGR